MRSFYNLGLGLSIVFGFLFLAVVGELYYLMSWKRRAANAQEEQNDRRNAKDLFYHYFFCWKHPKSVTNSAMGGGLEQLDPELGLKEEKEELQVVKDFGEESIDVELMRLHNLAGPPRFLFTINEESKEDLESDDAKSNRGVKTRSMSDLAAALDRSPFCTPFSTPPRRFSPLETPYYYSRYGFNPLFESSIDSEMKNYRLGVRSSPPPKFKFLRDAEEKLLKRLVEEAEKRADGKDGSIGIKIVKNSGSSQVLPLCSSPSTDL